MQYEIARIITCLTELTRRILLQLRRQSYDRVEYVLYRKPPLKVAPTTLAQRTRQPTNQLTVTYYIQFQINSGLFWPLLPRNRTYIHSRNRFYPVTANFDL